MLHNSPLLKRVIYYLDLEESLFKKAVKTKQGKGGEKIDK